MQTQTAKEFSQKIADSPELQARIRTMTSVGELMAFTQELGFSFTGEDLNS